VRQPRTAHGTDLGELAKNILKNLKPCEIAWAFLTHGDRLEIDKIAA
jgi:hypothetical protein